MKKIISALLLVAMLALALASCGGNNGTDATTAAPQTTSAATTAAPTTTGGATTAAPTTTGGATTASPATTAAPDTTSAATTAATSPATTARTTAATEAPDEAKWEGIATSVKRLSENSSTFKIELSKHGDAEKTSRNDIYMVGPDEIELGVTPDIEVMVYERNKNAIDLLDLTVSYVYWDFAWSKQAPQIETVVQGHDPDAPDLFVNMIADLNVAALFGVFKDTWSIPRSYFDFSQKGWMTEWMNSLSLTGDRSYVLAGDYFLDVLRALGVLPINITMMDANADKLAPAILGDGKTLKSGEKLSYYFFDYVDEGNWTWSTLQALCEGIWADTSGDGQDSITDVLGIVADCFGGLTSEMYIFSTSGDDLFDVRPIEDQSSEYYGKNWIYYSEDSTALGKIFDAVAAVYSGSGSVATRGNYTDATEDKPGAAYHRIKFAEGTMLTAGTVVLGALEDEAFRDMHDLYSVVPLPKISVDKEYNTPIHTIGDAGAINVNTRKHLAISAFLQYCTEYSGNIREEFLEIVTKYKTTTYNQGTDRMLDIIYESVINGRDKMIEDCVGTDYRFFLIMMRGMCEVTGSELVSQYESAISAKQSVLDDIIKTWYTLPKTGS